MNHGSITPPTSKIKGVQSSKLSSSLKERLKRCGRYHPGTPVSRSRNLEPVIPGTPVSHLPNSESVTPKHLHTSSTSSTPDTPLSRGIQFRRSQSLTPTGCHSKKNLLNHSTPLSERIPLNSPDPIKIKTDYKKFHCPLQSSSSFNQCVTPSSENDPKRDVCHTVSFSKNETFEEQNNSVCKKIDAKLEKQSKDSACLDVITHTTKGLKATSSNTCNLTSSVNDSATISNAGSSSNLEDNQADLEKESLDKLVALRKEMQDKVKDQEEKLRKLKMVKMYREKNDLTELQRLIALWRSVTQTALTDLLDLHPSPRPNMSQLVAQLGVDPAFVGYDEDEDSFV